jgi:hypothetical protein
MSGFPWGKPANAMRLVRDFYYVMLKVVGKLIVMLGLWWSNEASGVGY